MDSQLSDAALVQRCLSGDRRAFGELISRYQTPLFNVARRTLKDDRDAEDVLQTVFMKAYEHLASFNPEYKFFSWVYRIAVNESINYAKRRRSHDSIQEGNTPVTDTRRQDDMQNELQDGLMRLTPENRALVLLKHFEGFSYDEIGYIMDIPAKTVKSRLYTARQRLRDVVALGRESAETAVSERS